MTNIVSDFTAKVFSEIDAMDAESVAARFAPNATLTFGNQPPIVGPDAIRSNNTTFFQLIDGIHHTVIHEWAIGDDTIIELQVTYDRVDGTSVTIPVVSIWTQGPDGRFTSYRVYYDTAPVFA